MIVKIDSHTSTNLIQMIHYRMQNKEQLNTLWERVRYWMDGKNELGNPIEGQATTGSVRFTETCEIRSTDLNADGMLSYDQVTDAFVSTNLELRNAQYRTLFRALEAYHDEAETLVNWRAILSAPVDRKNKCIGGIFPRIGDNDDPQ